MDDCCQIPALNVGINNKKLIHVRKTARIMIASSELNESCSLDHIMWNLYVFFSRIN